MFAHSYAIASVVGNDVSLSWFSSSNQIVASSVDEDSVTPIIHDRTTLDDDPIASGIDAGARKALRENGKSLLPPGIVRCEGDFAAGDVVRVCDPDGTEFARGISRFEATRIKTRQLPRSEVVNRDNLVIL